MMVAKSGPAHASLSRQIKDRAGRKGYTAMALGCVAQDEGRIDAPIGRDPRNRKRMAAVTDGRDAVTAYRVVTRYERHTLLEVFPETGRTHQIRVHANEAGHPVVGDDRYGSRQVNRWAREQGFRRLFLHARSLGFAHPAHGSSVTVRAPLDPTCKKFLAALRREARGRSL